MRTVIQKVRYCKVVINEKIHSQTGPGLLVYLAIRENDNKENLKYLTDKILNLRIFPDRQGKMNLSIKQTRGQIMVISQFTLYGETKGQNRPSFSQAAKPEIAKILYEQFIKEMEKSGLVVKNGIFGAKMEIESINDGPVTIIISDRTDI